MARKQKHPEHENLERWLISYADFITLLFATFVVLYALSQVDVADFKKLEESIKQAFSAPSVMQGADNIMQDKSQEIFDKSEGETLITPLMMEYMSQKYEEQSFDDIQKTIDDMNKNGEIDGVEATMTDRGLLIRFNDNYLFKPASATLTPQAKQKLDKVGAVIGKRFFLHNIRVEGHTDNQKIVSIVFPSNWELSSARSCSIIRYLIERFGFMPGLFSAIGFADTRPIASNRTPQGQFKNRRVELLILKNQFKAMEVPQNNIMKMSKKEQEELQKRRMETINTINVITNTSDKSFDADKRAREQAAILNATYEKELKRISKETQVLDDPTKTKITGQGSWLKPPAKPAQSQGGKTALPRYVENEFKNVGR
ncbi:MAG TPA: OmpA family protein [Candidatus Gastranaerophilaceae bacterium]|nr:OmpA family protein [Candidatus Gastranaerophilaceae bacterium]